MFGFWFFTKEYLYSSGFSDIYTFHNLKMGSHIEMQELRLMPGFNYFNSRMFPFEDKLPNLPSVTTEPLEYIVLYPDN